MRSIFPQQDGPQTAMNNRSEVEIILFMTLDLEERIQLYKREVKTKMWILHSRDWKKTNLARDTVIRKIFFKICVKYTTSDRGNLELQNLQDRLSWWSASKTMSVMPPPESS